MHQFEDENYRVTFMRRGDMLREHPIVEAIMKPFIGAFDSLAKQNGGIVPPHGALGVEWSKLREQFLNQLIGAGIDPNHANIWIQLALEPAHGNWFGPVGDFQVAN